MSVHSSQKKKRRDPNRIKFKAMGKQEFLTRITKTLYYGKSSITERLSLPVTELAAELYSEVKAGRSLERLRLEEAAEISRNTCASPCSLVLAILYLERLKCCNPNYLDRAVPSELFLISMMVASKFLNDDGEEDEVLNSEWAMSAGLTLKEVNRLEKEFLAAINWEVFIKESTFWNRLRKLERDIALKEGKRRGWFSYTELENLLDCLDSFTLAQALFTVSAVCLASYTAGILTVVGSTMLVSHIPTAYLMAKSVSLLHTTTMNSPATFGLEDSTREIIGALDACSTNFSCKTSNRNDTRTKPDFSWDFDFSSWLVESPGKNDTNENSELLFNDFPILPKDLGIGCFSSMSNYLYSVTQHIQYFPIQITVSH